MNCWKARRVRWMWRPCSGISVALSRRYAMFTTSTSGWWGKTGDDAPCTRSFHRNDHDALLNRILHFLEHKYEIAHATVQMEYQPCSGPECHLNTMHAGQRSSPPPLARKRVRTSLTRAVYPHPAAVQRNERQQEVFQRHGDRRPDGQKSPRLSR